MVVAECAEAPALLPDDAAPYRFFRVARLMGSGTQESWTAWLNLISRVLTDHLRRDHGPVAWTDPDAWQWPPSTSITVGMDPIAARSAGDSPLIGINRPNL
ncbi:hypothetical protein [Embleya sp. NPDC005575]|uniref:hypothetical protein n=1 Tax=Embleya sp. NPDC005575 TaxID=3156892 RepID=UPI0033BF1582